MLYPLLLLPVVGAVERLVWGGATPLKQCEESTITWTGGTPPYSLQIRVVDPDDYLSMLKAGETDRWIAENITESSYVWRVDYAAGNGIIFGVEDSSNPKRITGSYAGALAIDSGTSDCELVPVPSSSSSSAAFQSTTSSKSPSQASPVKTVAKSSLAQPTIVGQLVSSKGGSTNVGAIVGGVVGGVLGLALIIGVVVGIWLCTRRRQRVKEEKEDFVIDDTAAAMEPMEAMETAVHPITPYRGESKSSYGTGPGTPTLVPLLPSDAQPPTAYALSPHSLQTQQVHAPFAMPGPYSPASPRIPPSEYASEYAVDAGPVREQHPPRYDPRWSQRPGKP